MILIDAHVHIYDCFDLDLFFDSALRNFKSVTKNLDGQGKQAVYVLLLAEGELYNWFSHMVLEIEKNGNITTSDGKWELAYTGEKESLCAMRSDAAKDTIYLIAGRQIATAENIEVLSLFCTKGIADGTPLAQSVALIKEYSGIPTLPWGVGKWQGRRGKILLDFLAGKGRGDIYLGDNGGRPKFWPTPKLISLAKDKDIAVLPGSDPLPMAHEALRVGSFGCFIDQEIADVTSPALCIKEILFDGAKPLQPFGKLQSNLSFIVNQVTLRLAVGG